MASDGQITFGGRIDNYSMKKVRKINGCLVGGAGRLASVLQFFDWFQDWSDAQQVQGDAPHVKVFVPEGIDDEDFNGLVVFADGVVFIYEGGKKSYQLNGQDYFAIGSGSDYALAAMDAGADATQAVSVAIHRDIYSGGEIFSEELDPEPTELTREIAEGMDKEELIKILFGESDESKAEAEDKVIVHKGRVVVTASEKVLFLNPENGDILEEINFNDSEPESAPFKRVVKSLNRGYFDAVASEIGLEFEVSISNKVQLLDLILDHLSDLFIAELQEAASAD